MTDNFANIKKSESDTQKVHSRRYWWYFSGQLFLLIAVAVAGFIHSFAQSGSAQGTLYENPHLLFWSGVMSAGLPVIVGFVTLAVAKQKSRRDFHTMMVGKLQRNHFKTPEEADELVNQYFEHWRD